MLMVRPWLSDNDYTASMSTPVLGNISAHLQECEEVEKVISPPRSTTINVVPGLASPKLGISCLLIFFVGWY